MRMSSEQLADMKSQGLSIGLSNLDINDLFNHIESLEKNEKQLQFAVGQLQKEYDELMEDHKLVVKNADYWQKQVPQNVELPKEVAEAINICLEHEITEFGIISLLNVTNQLFRDYTKDVVDALNIIKSFSFSNTGEDDEGRTGATLLLQALVNGNTVKEEPTVEEQLRTVWTPVVEKVVADYHGDAAPHLTREIINEIMPLTREVLKAVEAEEGK